MKLFYFFKMKLDKLHFLIFAEKQKSWFILLHLKIVLYGVISNSLIAGKIRQVDIGITLILSQAIKTDLNL